MLFEWHGILQFVSQSTFSFESVFCFFHCSLPFYGYAKNSADTNAEQSRRLTHCIKNLHCYNLKSFIFKHSLLFIRTPECDTTFEDFFLTLMARKCYISSFNLFHLVNFRARKKKIETWHFRFNFPHHTQAKVKSPSPGLTNQILHSPGTENRQMPRFARARMLKFRFDRRIINRSFRWIREKQIVSEVISFFPKKL